MYKYHLINEQLLALNGHKKRLRRFTIEDLTSLSKLSICRSWIARSRLVWWKWSLTLKNRSRSLRLREFSTRPSTKWAWKVWEYWGNPTSLSHDVETQWWSISEAFDSLREGQSATSKCGREKNTWSAGTLWMDFRWGLNLAINY